MAKRKGMPSSNRKIKEERGLGQGQDYKQWIKIQDFPSSGRVTRIKGIKTNRQHEFLSDLERNYFHFLDFSEKVIDIREQFPLLPIEETQVIAKELGIKHPEDPHTKEPIVITTDFLITVKDSYGNTADLARTLKYKEKLLDKRVLEKFEIERVYFEKHEIGWGIVTEVEVDPIVAKNLADIHAYYELDSLEGFGSLDLKLKQDLINALISRVIDYSGNIRNILNTFDEDMSLVRGSGIALLKHLLSKKILFADLKQKLNFNSHLELRLNIENARGEVESI